jgi:hypothetical protein
MKQRPIQELENVAADKAVTTALQIRPDLDDHATRALLALVARESARNTSLALHNEGYVGQAKSAPAQENKSQAIHQLPLDQLIIPVVDLALASIVSMMAKQAAKK